MQLELGLKNESGRAVWNQSRTPKKIILLNAIPAEAEAFSSSTIELSCPKDPRSKFVKSFGRSRSSNPYPSLCAAAVAAVTREVELL
jgi:hypothetical protein